MNASDILRIVKEDILRILAEKMGKESRLGFVKSEVKASSLLISEAVKELEGENLIQVAKDSVGLTKQGQDNANTILEKHLTVERYFKKARSEEEAHKAANILEHYISQEVLDNIKKLSTFKGGGLPLTEFELTRENLITDIEFSVGGLFERVVSMGILPGEKIRIMYKIPDGFVVNVSRKKIALGEDIAKKIKVLK